MILGNGLLARAFQSRFGDDREVLIFACGVSNSSETRPDAFARERGIMQRALQLRPSRLVYFSCCSLAIADPTTTAYMRHKREMESLVDAAASGLILRLPQVVGRSANPHTLANYLYRCISTGKSFELWNKSERNLIDVDDVAAIAAVFIDDARSHLQTIATAHSMPMPAIVVAFERVLARPAVFTAVDKGEPLPVDSRQAAQVAASLGIDFNDGYLDRLLRKYYGAGRRRP